MTILSKSIEYTQEQGGKKNPIFFDDWRAS